MPEREEFLEEEIMEDYNRPQPQYGEPAPPSVEHTEFMVTDKPFLHKEGHEQDDHFVESGSIPQEMLAFFWGFLDKDNVLSNTTVKEIDLAMLRFKRAKQAYIMSQSRGEFTFKKMRYLNNLQHKVKMKLLRSVGGFERKQENSATTTQLHGVIDNQPSTGGLNPLKNLFG